MEQHRVDHFEHKVGAYSHQIEELDRELDKDVSTTSNNPYRSFMVQESIRSHTRFQPFVVYHTGNPSQTGTGRKGSIGAVGEGRAKETLGTVVVPTEPSQI